MWINANTPCTIHIHKKSHPLEPLLGMYTTTSIRYHMFWSQLNFDYCRQTCTIPSQHYHHTLSLTHTHTCTCSRVWYLMLLYRMFFTSMGRAVSTSGSVCLVPPPLTVVANASTVRRIYVCVCVPLFMCECWIVYGSLVAPTSLFPVTFLSLSLSFSIVTFSEKWFFVSATACVCVCLHRIDIRGSSKSQT